MTRVPNDLFEALVQLRGSPTAARRAMLEQAAHLEKRAEVRRATAKHAGRGSDREERALDYADDLEQQADRIRALIPKATNPCPRCAEPLGAWPEDHRCDPNAPPLPPQAHIGSPYGT